MHQVGIKCGDISNNAVKIDYKFTNEGSLHLVHHTHKSISALDKPKSITNHSYNPLPRFKCNLSFIS